MDKIAISLGLQIGRLIAGQRNKKNFLSGYSYNGTILPALPKGYTSNYAIFRKDGKIYCAYLDYIGSFLFGINKTDHMFFHRVRGIHYVLSDGAWVEVGKVEKDVGLCSKEDLIWCQKDVSYMPYNLTSSLQVGDVYMTGNDPILVPGSKE